MNKQRKADLLLVLITGYIINEKSPVEDMVRRYNNAVRTLSTFERKLEDEHSRDMNQLKRIKEDRDAKRQVSAAVAKPSVEKTAAPEAAPAEPGK